MDELDSFARSHKTVYSKMLKSKRNTEINSKCSVPVHRRVKVFTAEWVKLTVFLAPEG